MAKIAKTQEIEFSSGSVSISGQPLTIDLMFCTSIVLDTSSVQKVQERSNR